MAQKFLEFNDSDKMLKEVEALQSSAGAADAGKIPALDSGGKLDNSFMPSGVGADSDAMVCSEDLSAGDWVNIYDDTGTQKCRKADASDATKPACGFVLSGYTSGETATVQTNGFNTQVSGLAEGTEYFVSETAGAETTTPPTTSGAVVQSLGRAIATDIIKFEPKIVCKRA